MIIICIKANKHIAKTSLVVHTQNTSTCMNMYLYACTHTT